MKRVTRSPPRGDSPQKDDPGCNRGSVAESKTKTNEEATSLSSRTKAILGIGGGIAVLAVVAFFLFGGAEKVPGIRNLVEPKTCPLTGEEPDDEAILDRPAVAVKIENASVAYPLSGLEKADVVYEEAVEGGVTRFMAIYHCTDAEKAGPGKSVV